MKTICATTLAAALAAAGATAAGASTMSAAVGAKYIQIDWGWYGTEVPWTDEDRAAYAARHPELKDDATWVENTRADPFTTASAALRGRT